MKPRLRIARSTDDPPRDHPNELYRAIMSVFEIMVHEQQAEGEEIEFLSRSVFAGLRYRPAATSLRRPRPATLERLLEARQNIRHAFGPLGTYRKDSRLYPALKRLYDLQIEEGAP